MRRPTDENCPVNGQHLGLLASLIKHRAHTIELMVAAQIAAGTEDYQDALAHFALIESDANNAPNWHPRDDLEENESAACAAES